MAAKRTKTAIAERLEALAGLDLSGLDGPIQPPAGIVSLPISAIHPDLFQARRVLPPPVREGYLSEQLDPPGALIAWRSLAEEDLVETRRLAVLTTLADSLRSQKQINPITAHPLLDGQYQIETGERRWWAHWWLVTIEHLSEFDHIQAQIVEEPNPWRQAVENLQDEPLNATQQACQVARLLLAESGIGPPQTQDRERAFVILGYEYFRQATSLGHAQLYGRLGSIASAIGLSERYCQYLLQLLKLDDAALSAADRYNLTEFQLRPIAAEEANPERQRRLVQLIGKYDLPSREAAALVREKDLDAAEQRIVARRTAPPARPLRAVRPPERVALDRIHDLHQYLGRLAKADSAPGYSVAHYLAADPNDVHQLLEEIASVQGFLEELRRELENSPD